MSTIKEEYIWNDDLNVWDNALLNHIIYNPIDYEYSGDFDPNTFRIMFIERDLAYNLDDYEHKICRFRMGRFDALTFRGDIIKSFTQTDIGVGSAKQSFHVLRSLFLCYYNDLIEIYKIRFHTTFASNPPKTHQEEVSLIIHFQYTELGESHIVLKKI